MRTGMLWYELFGLARPTREQNATRIITLNHINIFSRFTLILFTILQFCDCTEYLRRRLALSFEVTKLVTSYIKQNVENDAIKPNCCNLWIKLWYSCRYSCLLGLIQIVMSTFTDYCGSLLELRKFSHPEQDNKACLLYISYQYIIARYILTYVTTNSFEPAITSFSLMFSQWELHELGALDQLWRQVWPWIPNTVEILFQSRCDGGWSRMYHVRPGLRIPRL